MRPYLDYTLVAPGDLRLEQKSLTVDALGEDALLCETVASAISPGTELAAFQGLPPLRPVPSPYPRRLGYMNVARVVATGSGSPLPAGTLVYTHAAHCSHFVVPRAKVLAVVPATLSPVRASVAYLYRLGWNGLRRAAFKPGCRVAVIGLGAIGLATVQLSSHMGGRTTAISGQAEARARAERAGAATLDKSEASERFLPSLSAMADHMDVVIVTTGSWEDWELALSMTAFNGSIAVLGFPGRGLPPPATNPLASRYFYDRQITIAAAGFAPWPPGSGNEPPEVLAGDIQAILAAIEKNELDPAALIEETVRADRLADAYHRMTSARPGPGTIVLDWQQVKPTPA